MKVFFRRTHAPLMQALPPLLLRLLRNSSRVLLLAPDDETLNHLNSVLWTFDDNAFVPHGTTHEPYPQHQPLLLQVPPVPQVAANAATCVVLLLPQADAVWQQALNQYTQVITVFSALDDPAMARAAWKLCKDAGHEIDYKDAQ